MSGEELAQTEGDGDASPLLPLQRSSEDRRSFGRLRAKQRARRVNAGITEADIIMEEQGYRADDLEAEFMANFSQKQKCSTMLVLHDAFFLILDFLQFYTLVAAISLRWPWPFKWTYSIRFVFLFNLDIWEFLKMNNPDLYSSATDNFIDSSLIGFDYRWYALGWAIFIFVSMTVYIGFYIAMNYQKQYNLLLQVARLQRVYIILCQVLAMPIGVMMAKLFHCNADGNMDVHNQTPCAGGEHLAYVIVPIAIYAGLFIMLPIWMIMKIQTQIISRRSERHEGFLQLKETEFAHGLDFIWTIKLYHLFSSFRLVWAYYRPVMFFFKLVLLSAYAALLWQPMWQMVIFLAAVCILFIMILIRRPFRVTSFNVYIMINFFCMLIVTIMGLMQNLFETNSVFFQAEYLFSELLASACFWLAFTVVWFAYVLLRYFGILCKGTPLWPEMTSRDVNRMSDETRKYMKALLKGRIILEHALSTYPLFSPVHELSRQIQIINAYCREAEFIKDPIHDTLWDLLDEMIEAHSRLAPMSLFSESVKASIRETAQEFMKLMPAFKKRLVQREYDFILITPVKRRILLKMFALGVLTNGKMNKIQAVDHTDTVRKLYNPEESLVLKQRRVEGDDGFYEDMDDFPLDVGPSVLRLMQQRQHRAKILIEEDEDDETHWNRGIPSRAESLVSSINDHDADDISDMMAGIPSRPGSMGSFRGSGSKSRTNSALSRKSLRSQIGSGGKQRGTGQQHSIAEESTHYAEDVV